jgi:glycosyltransferase involved in cell wall biosynthesis
MLAMARPVIAADTPANRDLLTHGESACLCPPGDPDALAEALLTLHRDPALRGHLAREGRSLYLRRCSEAVITARLGELTSKMLIRWH